MELSKNFTPADVEEKWYSHWKNKAYFRSIPDRRKPFTIVIPPPNVTGVLHMGHTLNETVQDILVRKARMNGFNACWVPGSDHASIATEAKVVQMLEKEKGIKKSQLTREAFLQYAFEWKEKYGNIIYCQLEKLGCSVDWERVAFTMDADYYSAVIKVFVNLYQKGLIYRGARMINWDPEAKTALSDEEVEYKDVEGILYYVRYKVADEAGDQHYISIATQRPETIMGDTAVCVNPDDERYAYLKGKSVIVPLVNRKVPVIFDEYVDKDFGTGALKITPAHDINDYNLGLKYNLDIVDTLNEDGTLSEAAQVFVGLDRFDARDKAIARLRAEGLLVKEEKYATRLGFSQRTHAVVEPRLSTQWFVKMKELAAPAMEEVTEGRIKIHPGDRFLATYKYWLENVKDWCISRQLWWGQRIPAWYAPDGSVAVAETKEEAFEKLKKQSSDTLIHHSPLSAIASAKAGFTIHDLIQDEDVMDTWFSSWLWPIEVFKGITHPGNEDIRYYYPTSVLVTGQDIIFFWVARMIMAGMEFMHERPFDNVYFTGMVRDKLGRKMSKQLGNSPDLLELIDKYGADAVRFGIMISSPAGNDLLFDDASLEQGRNFNNKLWNALKLVRMWKGRTESREDAKPADNFAVIWFENRLNEARSEVENLFKDFRLSEALKTIYSLIWDDFCSWYLEWVKPQKDESLDEMVYQKTILFFEELLQLLHPFMPFVTEEIYHHLKERKEGDDLTVKQQPAIGNFDPGILRKGNLLKEAISAIRDSKHKHRIKPKDPIRLSIETASRPAYTTFQSILARQVHADEILFTSASVNNAIALVVHKDKLYIETENEIDPGSQKAQLQKDLEYHKNFLASVDKKLDNERFVKNAKPEVVELERKKKADAEAKIKAIEESLASL